MLLISIELLITPCEYADLGCPHGRIASESVHTCINCESTLTIYNISNPQYLGNLVITDFRSSKVIEA